MNLYPHLQSTPRMINAGYSMQFRLMRWRDVLTGRMYYAASARDAEAQAEQVPIILSVLRQEAIHVSVE